MALLDDARTYIDAAFGPTYTTWMALGDADANRTLTSATRYIDSFGWQGTATGVPAELPASGQWPRSGVTIDGVELSSTAVPDQVIKAVFELAVLINDDPSLVQNADAGSNIASLGAGPAQLSFFRPTSAQLGSATVLPPMIHRMIGQFLAGAGAGQAGAVISGINSRTDFNSCDTKDRDLVWPV